VHLVREFLKFPVLFGFAGLARFFRKFLLFPALLFECRAVSLCDLWAVCSSVYNSGG
jgi:hypothetical protein